MTRTLAVALVWAGVLVADELLRYPPETVPASVPASVDLATPAAAPRA